MRLHRSFVSLIAFICLALFSFGSLASAQQVGPVRQASDVVPVDDKGGEPGFMEKYVNFTMDDYKEPVKDSMILTWIGSCFCPIIGYGLNYVSMGDDRPEDSDALMAALVWTGVDLGLWILSIPTGGLLGLGVLAVNLYFAPVNILNAQNRALGGGGSKGDGSKSGRRRLRDDEEVENQLATYGLEPEMAF
jgi:hypothetical protein